ncbi:Protein phosphatase 2C 37 [Platanthera guangdongensis]|uniref:protein-serine/threonine phosphatase n=1 Tax=Platanthera guangdongensis TaxID=2320717 RepID=A0ABR2LN07_9ASPA
MAEICCGMVAGGEPAGTETTADICDITSRAARRRRIAIRRFKLVAGVDLEAEEPESERKRKMIELGAPIMELPDLQKDVSIGTVESTGGEIVEKIAAFSCSAVSDDSRSAAKEKAAAASTFSNECPLYGVMSVCGRRRDMEDSISVHPDMLQHTSQTKGIYHFFAVFDGHGCSHVAVSCKERMHDIVSEELNQLSKTPATILEWKKLMDRSFFRMDAEAASWRGGSEIPTCRCEFQTPKCDHVGSTAVVSVIFKQHIVVANCGDSRAVLCRNGTPVPLSDDHKPDRPDELRRIEDAGGRVIYWDGARVLGVLAMSRAIGDNYLKPFVISEPDVTVTEREEGDECLILASDGLWDVVTNETACQIVRMVLRGGASAGGAGSQKACADAATLLAKLALARHSADNVSVVVVDLRR